MERTSIIEIHPETLKFSAGHLMLTSRDTRETLHGHDYGVSCALKTIPGNNGFALDLREFREKLRVLCDSLDYRFIVPGKSPYVDCTESDTHWQISLAQQNFNLLKNDVIVLPISNITLEELSHWFINQLTTDLAELKSQGISAIQVKVLNGRHESGASQWGNW